VVQVKSELFILISIVIFSGW